MIKQCAVVALMAMTGLTGSMAWAARVQHTFKVFLEVPTRAFYILPSEPGWIHRPQPLLWHYPTSTLGSLRKNFDVRHASSAIEARLESIPYLSNGKPSDDILLQVSFNDVVLSAHTNPQEVLSQAEAAVGKRVALEIAPIEPPGGYRPGDYSGTVMLMFNAKTPGA